MREDTRTFLTIVTTTIVVGVLTSVNTALHYKVVYEGKIRDLMNNRAIALKAQAEQCPYSLCMRTYEQMISCAMLSECKTIHEGELFLDERGNKK